MASSAAIRIQQPGRSKSTPVRRALGAQLRVTDDDGLRLTALVTNTTYCDDHPDRERIWTAEPSDKLRSCLTIVKQDSR